MALTPFNGRIIVDTGISMGDEGKGRLIPDLIMELQEMTGQSDPAAMVLKVNGGANSGHTAGGLKLNLMPAGVVASSVRWLAIGSGVVADPRKALWEVEPLEKLGHALRKRLIIDERAMVSDLSHRLLDLAWEHYRVNTLGEAPRGSTGRGISPAYMDEVGQFQIHYSEVLGDRSTLTERLKRRLERAIDTIRYVCRIDADTFSSFFETLTAAEKRANAESIEQGIFPEEEFDFNHFKGANDFEINADLIVEVYLKTLDNLSGNIGDVRELVHEIIAEGRYVIGEFGQSYWLDKRAGFPPNVTASHTYTAEIFQSAGLPVQPVHTIGCCKAYDTKVGTHVFLTQMPDDNLLTAKLKQLEFGTSTGRQRMVGWFDAVEKGDALRYGGFEDLVINKLDALTNDCGYDGKLLVCTGYRAPDGSSVNCVPRNDIVRKDLTPIYTELDTWTEDISSVRSFADLPKAAQHYVAFSFKAVIEIAERGGRNLPRPNLRYIGVGPDPEQIIKDIPDTETLLSLA
ncbi:adenylosuccinate synthetase [Rubellicoccus peritrichatus]|uniref:Adenylosuccinate synthetase n=1 Tax=Rubellicoccus peritrichatus TaxID=3080537 RepID=A0AAQ3LEN0_9BACT|nr:adenylosuccinate synthetase [Puniceicoccus sp. CR14]WOO42223.1 adenylosuccinate synthetase [Puniceicoccus sp. CR14]